jgi:hypothetical protein
VIGIISVIPTQNALLAQIVFMAIWSFVYQATIGSVAWVILTEVSTSALRGHTQALATMVQGIVGTAWSFALPYIINPDQANMGGKITFIYGSIMLLSAIAAFLIIPETKGRSFADIDALFNAKVPIRRFKQYDLNVVPVEKQA